MVTTVSCRGARLIQLDYCLDDLCSVAQSCAALCDPVDCSTAGWPVLHCLLQLAQTHVHWVGDAIQPSHAPLPPSPRALTLSQHQGLFQWIGSLHQVAKVLELQLQSCSWIFKVKWGWLSLILQEPWWWTFLLVSILKAEPPPKLQLLLLLDSSSGFWEDVNCLGIKAFRSMSIYPAILKSHPPAWAI